MRRGDEWKAYLGTEQLLCRRGREGRRGGGGGGEERGERGEKKPEREVSIQSPIKN